jgi:DNA-binding SARP family transcriptional activator
MSTFCRPVTEINAPSPLRIQPRLLLLARMDELRASPILWVGGPPASGKTALVASYLSTRELAGTWCRMGRQSDAGALATSLAHVLQRVSRPGVLIIEDSHQIPVTVLAELTTEWTSCGPAGVQLILIGRGEPPTSLAPLIVKGVIGTLGASALRFSFEEMRQWTASLNVDTSALMQWHEKCQGWALGIARVLEGLRRHPEDPMQASEIAKQDLFAYFAAEVFEPATPIERQALVSAALVARTSSRVASALSGSPEAFEVLVRMAERHNFTTRAAGMPRSYELMPLFREFLLACIADTFPSAELSLLAIRATALLDKEPQQDWLGSCDLLKAYFALRRGDRTSCHQLLRTALNEADYAPGVLQACAVFPTAASQLCAEALRESIAPESAQRLIERYRLPAPAQAGRHWPWPFKVYMLDGFRLLQTGGPIRLSRRGQRKPLELLQALIAFGATEVPARALIDALWPDSEGDAGYHALESALYRLRQMLGAADAVRMASSRLTLDRGQFWVDLWEFEHELQSARSGETNITERVGRIRQLYAGHFLEHESEKPWALKTRQELRDRFMSCMRDAARVYESRSLWQEAAKLYQYGLELDSLNEDLYRGLMVCHRELGDHSEALQAYRRCRELLTRFLGIPPNAKTQAIYHSVRERAACAHP